MTQEDLIEKEAKTLIELTGMLGKVNTLLDKAIEENGKEDQNALLSQALKTFTKFQLEHGN